MKLTKSETKKLLRSSKILSKPYIRHVRVEGCEIDSNIVDVFCELGLTVYEDPNMDNHIFISNIPLTYQWLLDNRLSIDHSRNGRSIISNLKATLKKHPELLTEEIDLRL